MYKIKVQIDECDGCGECADICPNEVLKIVDGKVVLMAEEDCAGCESCVEACPKDNITIEEL